MCSLCSPIRSRGTSVHRLCSSNVSFHHFVLHRRTTVGEMVQNLYYKVGIHSHSRLFLLFTNIFLHIHQPS